MAVDIPAGDMRIIVINDDIVGLTNLFDRGLDVNARYDSQTILHMACENCKIDIVQLLIDKNIDRTIRDINGDTGLDIAERHGYIDIINLLQFIPAQSMVAEPEEDNPIINQVEDIIVN